MNHQPSTININNMLITKNTPRLPKKLPPPELKWQTGQYSRIQEFRFHLPYSFLLLCKLWDTTPDDVLHWFMENMSQGSWHREGKEKARETIRQYILDMGYGQHYYKPEYIQEMMTELNAIGMLWPKNAGSKMITRHARWRNYYYNWWFKKWHKKIRRKI